MERAFVNINFPKIDVIPVFNGNTWTTYRLCEQIITKFRAKNTYPAQVVVWIDREENPDDSGVIAQSVRNAFADAGYPAAKVHCLIPDRMSENIILADEDVIREEIGDQLYTYGFEGQNGKHHLKTLLSAVDKPYKETTHGPKLLKKIRLSRARTNSPSVDLFLSTFPLNCWWT